MTSGRVRRLDALRLHVELTRMTIALRRARAADPTGQWPAQVPTVEAAPCADLHWIYTPGAAPSLHPEGDSLPWYSTARSFHPLSVELH